MSDLIASTESYRAALASLRYEVLMDFDFGVGLGAARPRYVTAARTLEPIRSGVAWFVAEMASTVVGWWGKWGGQ